MDIMPLYTIRTRSSQEKQQAWSVWTSTFCCVLQSQTIRLELCTHRTTAHMLVVILVFSKGIPPLQTQCMLHEGRGCKKRMRFTGQAERYLLSVK